MKRPGGLFALGFAALTIQGTLGTFAPAYALPDLLLLFVVGMGVCVGGVEGLLVTAALGYTEDLLSGALLGQHALLLALAFAATRIATRTLSLQRPFARLTLVAGLSLLHGLGVLGLTALFADAGPGDFGVADRLLLHAGVNAALAPFLIDWVERAAAQLGGEEEAARPSLRVETRGRGY